MTTTDGSERDGHEPPYRLLAEMASDVAMQINADSRVVWISPAIEEVLGWRVDEIVGTSIFDRMHPDDVARGQRARDNVMSGNVVRNDLRFLTKDGVYRWMSARLAPVVDEHGHVVGRVAGWHDVTAEYTLREALEVSEREAQEASRAKTMFLSRMSHELRTPLNAVLGFAQLLQLEPLTPTQSSSVEKIVTGGRHLLDLINEVLDITSIESGRVTMTLETVALADVVAETIELVRGLAASVDVTVVPVNIDGCGHSVLADRQRIVQIMLNLLSNAVKYHRPSGTVRVSCVHVEDGMVGIEVADDGPGIAPEMLGRLLQPFDRLGAERTGIEGTGIGLAVARSLAEAMHGRLEVQSAVDVGSTFTLVLPEG